MKKALILSVGAVLVLVAGVLATAYFTDLEKDLFGKSFYLTFTEQLTDRGPLLVPYDIETTFAGQETISLGLRTFEFGDVGIVCQDGTYEFLGTGQIWGGEIYVVRYRRPAYGDKWQDRLDRAAADNLNVRNLMPDGAVIFRTESQMRHAYAYTRDKEMKRELVAQLVP